jgi:hypothetical protein
MFPLLGPDLKVAFQPSTIFVTVFPPQYGCSQPTAAVVQQSLMMGQAALQLSMHAS